MTDLKEWLSRRTSTMCDLTHDYLYKTKTKTSSMSRVEVCEWQPRKGTHSSTEECIVTLYTPPSTLSKHNTSQTHTMSHLLPWDPQWLIETTFSMTVVNSTGTNRNCSNTQWNTWWQEPLWPLTACKQQLQTLHGFTMSTFTHTGTHTDLHSTWASTGERWDGIRSCSRATSSTALMLSTSANQSSIWC